MFKNLSVNFNFFSRIRLITREEIFTCIYLCSFPPDSKNLFPSVIDSIDHLLSEAICYETKLNKNQFITQEIIIQRIHRKITEKTVSLSYVEDTVNFYKWHEKILNAFLDLRSLLSHDEKIAVERVLSKVLVND